MIDWDKPVQTRDGKPVLIFTRQAKANPNCPIVGEFQASDVWWGYGWSADGRCPHGDPKFDLVNAPEEPKKHTLWLNVYKAKGGFYVASYSDAEEANDGSSGDRIACIKVEFQEGDGLENHESPEQRLPASLVGGEVTTDYQPPEPKRSWP